MASLLSTYIFPEDVFKGFLNFEYGWFFNSVDSEFQIFGP